MSQNFTQPLAIFVMIVSIFFPNVAASQDVGILYGVQGKSAKCILLGAAHYNYGWEDSAIQPNVKRAFEASQLLFVESFNTGLEYRRDLSHHTHWKKETKLVEVLNDVIKESDKKFISSMKAAGDESFWTALQELSVYDYSIAVTTTGRALHLVNRKLGDSYKRNFSSELNRIAYSKGIKSTALEQPSTHARLWNDYANKDMNLQLILDNYAAVMDKNFIEFEMAVNQSVRIGDVKQLENIFSKVYEAYPSKKFEFDTVIAARNISWTEKLNAYLTEESGGTCFVNVGALHYLGPKGLVALLENKGSEVKRLKTVQDVDVFLNKPSTQP